MEDVEKSENRAPKDLDVVTFYSAPHGMSSMDLLNVLRTQLPEFFDRDLGKARFRLDHYGIHLGAPGISLVDNTRYWAGLFSHRRDGVWKGMVRVELGTSMSDTLAMGIVASTP